MHLTRRLLTTATAITAVLTTALSAAPSTAAAAYAPCTSAWQAVQNVAVRMPAWNEGPVATTHSPIVRYLRRDERVRSCIVAVGRTSRSQYRECGGGSLWRIVPGGQVPSGCLRRA